MQQASIYLSHPGIINALGSGRESIAAALWQADTSGMVDETGWIPQRTIPVGRAQGQLPDIPPHLRKFDSRNNQLLLAATLQIQAEIEAAIAQFGPHRVGVVLGTSTSGIAETEAALRVMRTTGELPETYDYAQHEFGSPSRFLSEYFGLTALAYTVSTACTSSAKAFQSARNLIRHRLCDAVIVGGVDSLCNLTFNGFHALESISSTLCNPMSVNRSGINIGEGAALFVMRRDASPFQLLGIGESSDAWHISSPHPEGTGAKQAMQYALQDAALSASDIWYLNLHATATPKNDAMESLAVAEIFSAGVPCSGTKPYTGHTLGAAGATEIAICALAIQDGKMPAHHWDGCADTEMPALNLVTAETATDAVAPRICMSNSFAFGGSNASVILGAGL
ncbi:MAG: beta-ketoacyl-[acyl-carrier-protein] synthase family protein [Methylophilus sp.]|uniref:beta-ketoacyl-[acyl-carrier-protein] synthase family protein n=1 Tax=Methylophilus sp. TaxID=29541 RepID=UPI003F9FD9A5